MPAPLDSEQLSAAWQRLQDQLAALGSYIDSGFAASPDDYDARLRERAAQLARSGNATAEVAAIELLAFSCGEEVYAIELEYLAEVVPLRHYTRLPSTPPFVLGIVSVRGRIVSVIDVGVFFELPRRGLSDLNYLVILHGQDQEFGLLTDRLLGLHRLPRDQLQTQLPHLTGIRASYLLGVSPQQWTVLDASRMLAAPALRIDQNSQP